MQIEIINQKLKALFATERKITHEVLLLIQTLDITQAYSTLGYSSLFEYLIKEIGYSEGSAQRRISAARLMKQVPDVGESLKLGELNLTQLALARTAIRQEEKALGIAISNEKKAELLFSLKKKNSFETQKTLKSELPSFQMPQPKVTPAGGGRVFVTLEFSEKDWKKVQDLQAYFSNVVTDLKLESLLLYWHQSLQTKQEKQLQAAKRKQALKSEALKEFKKNESQADHDLETEITVELRQKKTQAPLPQWQQPQRTSARSHRKAIPSAVKIQIYERANGQCEFVSDKTGKRCESKHFTEKDHITPVARGGGNDLQNLRLLCRTHNILEAKRQGLTKW